MSELKIKCITYPDDLLTIRPAEYCTKANCIEIEVSNGGYDSTVIHIDEGGAIEIINHLAQQFHITPADLL